MLPLSNDLQDLSEEGAKRLSPGLCYLELVCQRLEDFAEQQRHNRALQREGNALQEQQEEEVSWAEAGMKVSQQVGFVNLAR